MRFTITLFFIALFSVAYAQEKPLSPLETIKGKAGGAEITVVYCRPSARGRVMIGGKEPFGKVWRTGANAATTIEFDRDVLIQGQPLRAGTYSLFTIPDEKEWTIIFNKVAVQWGAYNYNEKEDVLRVKVKRDKPASFVETFTIDFQRNNIVLTWENYLISIPVKAQ